MSHNSTPSRATFTVDGQPYGAIVTADPDGYLLESVDYPECWTIGPTIEQAAYDLAALVAPRLPPPAFRVLPSNPLDRRPDLRARFSSIVARANAKPEPGWRWSGRAQRRGLPRRSTVLS